MSKMTERGLGKRPPSVAYIPGYQSLLECFVRSPSYAKAYLDKVLAVGTVAEIERARFWYAEAQRRRKLGGVSP